MAATPTAKVRSGGLSAVAWICLLAVVIGAVASVGVQSGADTATNAIAVLDSWLRGGWAPALFLLASYGLGRVFDRWTEGAGERRAVRLALGLAVSLTVVHGLGVLGLLSPATAIGLVAVGLFLLLAPGGRHASWGVLGSAPRVSWWSVMAVVPVGIGLVAAASPPGWLWGSEFGGYDALSYHLALPQEWLRTGRVWPVEHNVYSFLPSYLESVSVLLARLTLAPIDSAGGHGLTAGNGWRATMPQMLHFLITLGAAWAVGRLAAAMVRATEERRAPDGPDSAEDQTRGERVERSATFAAWVAGLLVLATPWVLVVGTLAYNEMAVVLLGAGAMLVALDRKVGPAARGVLCAVLVGVACGCKPTALLFVAPPVGVVLLMRVPRGRLAVVIGLGVLAGVLTLSPWLIRNQVATGNPVFPAMSGTFGPGHYDTDQIARYAGAHEYHGSVVDRVRLLVWTDPAAGEGSAMVERFRGLGNPQWFVLGPFGVLGLGLLLLGPGARRVAVWLGLGLLLQLAAWAAFTHLQSRFLLPCVLTLCPAVGVALAAGVRSRVAAGWVGALVVLAQTGASGVIFAGQHGRSGGPNLRLASGTSIDTGRPPDPAVTSAVPSAFVNAVLPTDSVVYLLGDATPFYFERRVVYNTTYDDWPLGEAIELDPGSPEAWSETLRARGITHVLVSPSELGRLTGSGWIDPAVMPERLVAWLETLPRPIMAWPVGSDRPVRVLYRLDHASGGSEPAEGPSP